MSASCLDLLDHLHGSVSVVESMNVDYTVVTERATKPRDRQRWPADLIAEASQRIRHRRLRELMQVMLNYR